MRETTRSKNTTAIGDKIDHIIAKLEPLQDAVSQEVKDQRIHELKYGPLMYTAGLFLQTTMTNLVACIAVVVRIESPGAVTAFITLVIATILCSIIGFWLCKEKPLSDGQISN